MDVVSVYTMIASTEGREWWKRMGGERRGGRGEREERGEKKRGGERRKRCACVGVSGD